MTLTEKVIDALKARSIDARKPANYAGECKAPYVVVQDAGVEPTGRTTGRRMVLLHVLVPAAQPAKMAALKQDIARAMLAVPMLRPGEIGAEGTDDEFKALVATLTYTALCAR